MALWMYYKKINRFMFCRIAIIFTLLFVQFHSFAQIDVENYYWIKFSDKNGSLYTINLPEEFLSARAIQRRTAQGISINEQDLPVSQTYIDSISKRNIQIIHTSKWLNGATVKTTQPKVDQLLLDFNFITNIELTKPGIQLKSIQDKFSVEKLQTDIDTAFYGLSVYQVGQLNGQYLHNNDFLGQGMHIAVLDAGFLKVDKLSSFSTLISENRIIETRDFVEPGSNVFEKDDHGMSVLSTMAGELPDTFIGTAPEAYYYLIRSEDVRSEYLIEEDNWVVAAEYADSIGVDIINSSLGYTEFDDPSMNHSYSELDGNTTRVTRAANIAVQKGMLVFSSVGNEGNDPWHFLVAPSDGDLVMGIGAVNSDGEWAPFSSYGPNASGEIKPNVSALGWGALIQRDNDNISSANGTSFSSPIMAGMASCLWQSFPKATNLQIKDAIEKSASQYNSPDFQLGYGIPNFELAAEILEDLGLDNINSDKYWSVSSNPFTEEIQFIPQKKQTENDTRVMLFSINGHKVSDKFFAMGSPLVFRNLSNLPNGVYVAFIESAEKKEAHKLVKISSN